jgi:hypothetical protein
VLDLLNSYSDLLFGGGTSGSEAASTLSVGALKVIKTAIGALLNVAVDYGAPNSLLFG